MEAVLKARFPKACRAAAPWLWNRACADFLILVAPAVLYVFLVGKLRMGVGSQCPACVLPMSRSGECLKVALAL